MEGQFEAPERLSFTLGHDLHTAVAEIPHKAREPLPPRRILREEPKADALDPTLNQEPVSHYHETSLSGPSYENRPP